MVSNHLMIAAIPEYPTCPGESRCMGCGALLVVRYGWCHRWPDDHRFERGALTARGIDERDLVCNGRRLLEHTANAAITSRRKLVRPSHRGCRQRRAGEDMLNLDRDEDFGMR